MTSPNRDSTPPDDGETNCSEPPCNAALMLALTPMHPRYYLNAACDEHRRLFIEGSPVFAPYDLEDWRSL